MKAVFVELPPFERYRSDYLNDDGFLTLQRLLMLNPEAGDVIPGTGGLRKVRFGDERRGKGKRGGFITGGMPVRSFGYSLFMTRMKCRI